MTADGSSAQHHAAASLITTFEKRAFARRCYGVLVVMFGLLAAAAFVFVRAKAITIDETTQDLPTIAKTLQDKATVAAAGVDTIKEGFVTRLTDALKGLGDVHRLGTKYAPANFHIEMADDSAKLRSRGDVVTEIGRDFEKSSHDEIDYEVRVRGNPLPWIRVKVTRKDVHELESKPASWGQFDFSSDLDCPRATTPRTRYHDDRSQLDSDQREDPRDRQPDAQRHRQRREQPIPPLPDPTQHYPVRNDLTGSDRPRTTLPLYRFSVRASRPSTKRVQMR